MKKILAGLTVLLFMAAFGPSVARADEYLQEWTFNINGNVYDGLNPAYSSSGTVPVPTNLNSPYDSLPSSVDYSSAFDTSTGLGTITYTNTNTGPAVLQNFDAFFDHDGTGDAFDNTASVNGTPATGQSWQIENPYGSIYGDVTAADPVSTTLDSTNHLTTGPNSDFNYWDDGSMAIGWHYQLGSNEKAVITMNLSTTAPTSGFYMDLIFNDQYSNSPTTDIYYWSTLSIESTGGTVPAVPEPSTLILLGGGLAGLLGAEIFRGKRKGREVM